MRSPQKRKTRQRRRLYYGGKISDYQFRRVLWHFACDHTIVETGQHVRLSTNSIAAIFGKLRTFLVDVRLFPDVGPPQADSSLTADEAEYVERKLAAYHRHRMSKKRSPSGGLFFGSQLHFAESCWRYTYEVGLHDRGEEGALRQMMFAHLMEIVLCAGPVGKPSAAARANVDAAREVIVDQIYRVALWSERNQVDTGRDALRDLRHYIRPLT